MSALFLARSMTIGKPNPEGAVQTARSDGVGFLRARVEEDDAAVWDVTTGDESVDPAVVLTCGKSLHLPRCSDEPVSFDIERTRQIDIVCARTPRTHPFRE